MSPLVTSPSVGGSRRAFGAHVRASGYDRYLFRDTRARVTAQVLVIPGRRVQMSVRADEDALGLDFRMHVTRPDLAGNYCKRPGFYLYEILQNFRKQGGAAVLLNGNNVGYWGNQFVIHNGKLVYKQKGPIFDDGRLQKHATGDHAFFLGSRGFRIANLTLLGGDGHEDTSAVDLRAKEPLPRCGLSGFPLLRSGRAVWKEHGELAWDPGLLFDLGPWSGVGHGDLREVVRELIDAGEELARHPMTVIGVDYDDNVVLLVVERSERSRGMTVAEAADLLRRRFGVRDAIVLGAAGDAQLATTEEGFLTEPLVASYARSVARRVPAALLSTELRAREVFARPVPCYVLLRLAGNGVPAADLPIEPSVEPAGMA